MTKNIIICAALVFFALSLNVALSAMVYPQEQKHSGLMGEKGSNHVIVNIGTGQSGKSIISLMLTPRK